jgi:uncharacterized protein
VGCAPNTIKRYIDLLEALFIIFRVTPYHRNIARSLLKEPKIYFYDTGMVIGGEGVLYENLVAISLLKHLNAIEDQKGKRTALHTLRTKEKKEVNFLMTVDGEPVTMIEAKLADTEIHPALGYFHQKYHLPAIQLVKNLRQEQTVGTIALRRAYDYLRSLVL